MPLLLKRGHNQDAARLYNASTPLSFTLLYRCPTQHYITKAPRRTTLPIHYSSLLVVTLPLLDGAQLDATQQNCTRASQLRTEPVRYSAPHYLCSSWPHDRVLFIALTRPIMATLYFALPLPDAAFNTTPSVTYASPHVTLPQPYKAIQNNTNAAFNKALFYPTNAPP